MKIVFKSETEKGEDEYKGVTVTENLTEPERKVVKMWSDKAKDRNKKNEDKYIIWRVRGSPRYGTMRLNKFPIIILNEWIKRISI